MVPLLTGLVGAILDVVLGTLVSGAICVLLALTKGWVFAVIVLVYFVVVHVIEGDVVGPRIVEKAIGLHPVISLASGEPSLRPPSQALLVAIWSEWRQARPDQFQKVKDTVAQQVEEHVADEPLGLEAVPKLLS